MNDLLIKLLLLFIKWGGKILYGLLLIILLPIAPFIGLMLMIVSNGKFPEPKK